MHGSLLIVLALKCAGASLAMALLARMAHRHASEAARPLARIATGTIVAGVGFLIWSKGV